MSHAAQSIERELNVSETPDGKGLKMTIELIVRDSGMMELNKRPINWGMIPGGSPGAWMGASELFAAHAEAFYKRVSKRLARAPRIAAARQALPRKSSTRKKATR